MRRSLSLALCLQQRHYLFSDIQDALTHSNWRHLEPQLAWYCGTDGGESDSGVQDGEGIPTGRLTNALKPSKGTYIQAPLPALELRCVLTLGRTRSFIGHSGQICDGLHNDIYDRLGCERNTPSNVQANTFQYISVYAQLAEIDWIDYTCTLTPVPTGSCTQFASAAIFTDGWGSVLTPRPFFPPASASNSGFPTSGTAAKATGTEPHENNWQRERECGAGHERAVLVAFGTVANCHQRLRTAPPSSASNSAFITGHQRDRHRVHEGDERPERPRDEPEYDMKERAVSVGEVRVAGDAGRTVVAAL
ncbi:hypothetical protein C8R45DRAFT_1080498 [Mycena sanguinolenta]|nr:hypothetical protein C8R45DRAFT_1080498 [Mycena sanguinolenta]